ncbi:MAG: glycosyl hydrolase, partial [Ignavibacteria bacterium]
MKNKLEIVKHCFYSIKMYKYFFLFLVLFLSCSSGFSVNQQSGKIIAPPENGIYVGAFPDMGGTEDSVTFARLKAFENLTGQKPVWIYFSNNWFGKIKFPAKEVQIIKEYGSIPFIRLMPRSDFTDDKPDPVYSLQKIIDGKFDKELKAWAIEAKNYGEPLMFEFGTEMNGNWFPWSGYHNGKNPEKFKDAYIHIIELFKNEETDNITFVFHVNYDSSPQENWNTMSAYYPGDEYIDWIGMSIYGAQKSNDEWINISEIFDVAYKEMSGISKYK